MKTNSTGLGGIRVMAVLVGVMCAGVAGAQQAPADAANLPDPRVRTASCAEVAWAADMLARYPRIAEGCHEVIVSEGRKWARFEADFVRNNPDGSVTLNFKDRQGRSMEDLTMRPAAAQRVSIDGRSYRFAEITRGETLNLYVPEGTFALATTPGAPTEQLAAIVPTPAAVAQEPPARAAQPATGQLLAQAEPAPRAGAQVLPNTAGPLPLLALLGAVSLLGGLGLTIRRRLFPRA